MSKLEIDITPFINKDVLLEIIRELQADDKPMTIKQCAEWLSVKESTVYRRCTLYDDSNGAEGLPYHELDGKKYFFKDEIKAMMS
jgi:hypothetical protein